MEEQRARQEDEARKVAEQSAEEAGVKPAAEGTCLWGHWRLERLRLCQMQIKACWTENDISRNDQYINVEDAISRFFLAFPPKTHYTIWLFSLTNIVTPVYIGMSYTVGKLRKCANHWTYLQNNCEKIGNSAGKEIERRGPPYFFTLWKHGNVGLINGTI